VSKKRRAYRGHAHARRRDGTRGDRMHADALLISLFHGHSLDDDSILSLLSEKRRKDIETKLYIVETAIRRLRVLQRCDTEEARQDYNICTTLLAAIPALLGDNSGMNKRVSTVLGMWNKDADDVYTRGSKRGKRVDDAERCW
jgi:hypothetical protein